MCSANKIENRFANKQEMFLKKKEKKKMFGGSQILTVLPQPNSLVLDEIPFPLHAGI